MDRVIRHRRRWLAALVITVAGALLSAVPATATPSAVDVWMQDNPSDNASEPSLPWSPPDVWRSPDIWVCQNPSPMCLADENPIAGQPAYLYVRLNRLQGATGNVFGTLRTYWTDQGGAAYWDGTATDDWNDISALFTIVPPGGTIVGPIPWNVPTSPTHFCLLARWDSGSDPMTFAEGPTTWQNAWQNNNIAWHNVNTVRLRHFGITREPFLVRNPEPRPIRTDLVIAPVGRPFAVDGKVIVNLGPVLAARWRESGQKGVGVVPVGDTQVQVVNPVNARIQGLLVNPREKLQTFVELTAGEKQAGGQFGLQLSQTDSQGRDSGGVEYRISVD